MCQEFNAPGAGSSEAGARAETSLKIRKTVYHDIDRNQGVGRYERDYAPEYGPDYSYFMDSIGLALAARTAWRLTVNKAVTSAARPAKT